MGDWLWDGGRISLDLVNTLRDRELGGRETLATPADLGEWLNLTGLPGTPEPADLATARLLRMAIDEAAFAARDERPLPAGAVDVINEVASATSLAPRLVVRDGRPGTAPLRPATTASLARLAVDAIEMLTGDDIARLRVCAADDCGVRFLDRSPARNRQWCSMRRCGNRTKASRHYARASGSAGDRPVRPRTQE